MDIDMGLSFFARNRVVGDTCMYNIERTDNVDPHNNHQVGTIRHLPMVHEIVCNNDPRISHVTDKRSHLSVIVCEYNIILF